MDAVRDQPVLGDGLRYRVCDGRPRGRSEAGAEDLRHHVRQARRSGRDVLLRGLPRRVDLDWRPATDGTAVLYRRAGSVVDRAVALPAGKQTRPPALVSAGFR